MLFCCAGDLLGCDVVMLLGYVILLCFMVYYDDMLLCCAMLI